MAKWVSLALSLGLLLPACGGTDESGAPADGAAFGLPRRPLVALALAGRSALMARYPVVETVSRAAGVGLLSVLGIQFARFVPKEHAGPAPQVSLHGPFMVGLGISAANPVLILTGSAAVATFFSMAHIRLTWTENALFVLGSFSGMLAAQWAFRAGGATLSWMAAHGAYATLSAG